MRGPRPLKRGSGGEEKLEVGAGFARGVEHPPTVFVEKDGGIDAVNAGQESADALPAFGKLHGAVEGDFIFLERFGDAEDLAVPLQQKWIRLVNGGIVKDAAGKRHGIGEGAAAVERADDGDGALVFYLIEVLEENDELGAAA